MAVARSKDQEISPLKPALYYIRTPFYSDNKTKFLATSDKVMLVVIAPTWFIISVDLKQFAYF